MGAVSSRLLLQRIETGLLSLAHLIDSMMRMVEHLLAAIVSRCFSRSVYAHFYVTPPKTGEPIGDDVTRVCTNDGVCYVPATRIAQHRALRKQKQEDRLKRRTMRAQWAAQGLDVQHMTKLERERKRRSRDGGDGDAVALNKLSRTTTSTTIDETHDTTANVGVLQRSPGATSVNLAETRDIEERSAQPSIRLLTAVREASSDYGAKAHMGKSKSSERIPKDAKKDIRRQSAPLLPPFLHLKAKASVDATSASRLVSTSSQEKAEKGLERNHRHTSSVPEVATADTIAQVGRKTPTTSSPFAPPKFTSPLGLALVQPKPQRPGRASFEQTPSTTTPAFAMRISATPPPAFLTRGSARTSFDLPSRPVSRTGTPGADDASSIRSSKRSSVVGVLRSTSPCTPPPSVVQLADKACKSRSISSAKERKEWKGEVKRIVVNKMNERNNAAHRTSRQA